MIKNVRIFNKFISIILSSTIVSTAMVGCSKKTSDNVTSQITISEVDKQDETVSAIDKHNMVYYNGLSKYFEHWSLFEKKELSENVNKQIDALLMKIKDQGMDLSEIDFDIIRQYILAPYVLYEGTKSSNVQMLTDMDGDGIEPMSACFRLNDDNNNMKFFRITKNESDSIYYYSIDEVYSLKNALISSKIAISKNGEYFEPSVCIMPVEYLEDESRISIGVIENKLMIEYKNNYPDYVLSLDESESKKQAKQLFHLILSNINELNDITIGAFLDKHQNELIDIFGDECLKIFQKQKILVKQ